MTIREVAGWLALGAAGVVAAGIAAWLFLGSDGTTAQIAASGAPDAGRSAARETNLGPIDAFAPEIGKPAPDFALLDARDGTTVRRLSDYRGKTVVLNWFATWCSPCRSEMPDFEAAYQALGAERGNVVFLLVNLEEPQQRAAGMLAETGSTYPAVLDSEGTVANLYRITGMPTTYFISAEGIVYNLGRGRITAETLRSELKALGNTY